MGAEGQIGLLEKANLPKYPDKADRYRSAPHYLRLVRRHGNAHWPDGGAWPALSDDDHKGGPGFAMIGQADTSPRQSLTLLPRDLRPPHPIPLSRPHRPIRSSFNRQGSADGPVGPANGERWSANTPHRTTLNGNCDAAVLIYASSGTSAPLAV